MTGRKVLAFATLSFVGLMSKSTVYATEIDGATQIVSSTGTSTCEVSAEKESHFEVTLPKNISVLDGTANYTISVIGDIEVNRIVSVVPDAVFIMKQSGKEDVLMNVTQEQQEWSYTDTNEEHSSTGVITAAKDLTAEVWKAV